MPDLDDTGAATQRTGASGAGGPSRRSVLRVAAGAGAAGIAATALGGVAATAANAATTKHSPHTSPQDASASDDIVVHVRNAAAGEIDVFRGTSQTRLHDRELTARIIRASR
jgi:hypothetical protein